MRGGRGYDGGGVSGGSETVQGGEGRPGAEGGKYSRDSLRSDSPG